MIESNSMKFFIGILLFFTLGCKNEVDNGKNSLKAYNLPIITSFYKSTYDSFGLPLKDGIIESYYCLNSSNDLEDKVLDGFVFNVQDSIVMIEYYDKDKYFKGKALITDHYIIRYGASENVPSQAYGPLAFHDLIRTGKWEIKEPGKDTLWISYDRPIYKAESCEVGLTPVMIGMKSNINELYNFPLENTENDYEIFECLEEGVLIENKSLGISYSLILRNGIIGAEIQKNDTIIKGDFVVPDFYEVVYGRIIDPLTYKDSELSIQKYRRPQRIGEWMFQYADSTFTISYGTEKIQVFNYCSD